MLRATMCPSSGVTAVFMRRLVLVILCGWLSGMQGGMKITPPCILDSHPHRITSTKCRINTAVSSDDEHIVARSMQRLINILRINCAPSWLYLQNYVRVTTCNLKTEVDKHVEMPYALDIIQVTETVKIIGLWQLRPHFTRDANKKPKLYAF
jgi:hypothetical protein